MAATGFVIPPIDNPDVTEAFRIPAGLRFGFPLAATDRVLPVVNIGFPEDLFTWGQLIAAQGSDSADISGANVRDFSFTVPPKEVLRLRVVHMVNSTSTSQRIVRVVPALREQPSQNAPVSASANWNTTPNVTDMVFKAETVTASSVTLYEPIQPLYLWPGDQVALRFAGGGALDSLSVRVAFQRRSLK